MKSFLLLLKIQVLGLFGLNRALHAKPGKAMAGMVAAGVGIVLLCAIVVLYVISLTLGLVGMGAASIVPLLVIEAGALAGACAAFPKASGLLFSFRDYELVMSLPISRTSVILSRIASLYAMSLALCVLIVVPVLAVLVCTGGVDVAPGVLIAVGVPVVLLAPVIPLAVTVALAALVAAVSTRFKRANIVMGVLGMLLIVGIVVGTFALGGMGSGTAGDAGSMGPGELQAALGMGVVGAEQLAGLGGALGVYAPASWAARAIMTGDVGALLLFVGASLAVGIALVVVLARVFVPVNEALRASKPRAAFTFEDAGWDGSGDAMARSGARAGSGAGLCGPLWALVGKEARLLVTTPVYLLNSCVGYVLALVAGVAALVGRLTGMLDGMLPAEYLPLVVDMAPWALAFCLGVSSTTTASVSLEGPARWLMQSAPVSPAVVLGAKALLGLALAGVASLASGVLCALALQASAMQAVAMVAMPLAMGVFATFVGLALDALKPRFDWTTPYEPVKRGFAVMLTMLAGMLVVLAGIFLASPMGWPATLAAAALVVALGLAAFWVTLRRLLPA